MTLFKSINPYNRELVVERPLHKKREWLGLLNKAHEGFLEWRLLSLDQRVDELQKVRAKLLERKEELAQMATVEMGKPIHEARAEIQKCVVSMEQLFEFAPEALATKTITADYYLSEVSYEGMGAILGIMPWNYPYWQVIRFAIPTLLAGNAVLLKHAPNVPGCSMLLEAVFQQSSRLGKVYNALYTDSKTTLKIIQKPEIRGVS
ncbi:MAG TPA: aldehyde dehydrogenase family protein, partial [Luteibaculaceae bacterium]|nr:aldehyde dehydrogenase family protein [Luteibaculaceae bacterium]